jgi:ubiquinone/menaquinone biosynthesis C-methylase UbiE
MKEQSVYEKFNEHWEGNKKYNIISRLNMFYRDRQIIKVLKEIKPRVILDVGCGIGRTVNVFKKSGFNARGIDNSESSISFCKKNGLEADLMDASRINFTDNFFEAVFAEGLLEHFENYEPFVKEMTRVSKKYILLIQPNAHSVFGKLLNWGIEHFTKDNVKEIPYRMEDYAKTFEKYDCKLLSNKGAALNTFRVLLFEKNNSK